MHLYAIHENLPLRDFQVTLSNFNAICESWKYQSLEYTGFEFPTCDFDYCSFPYSTHQGFHICDSLPFTRWLKVIMQIKINPKVFVFMGYLNWVLV